MSYSIWSGSYSKDKYNTNVHHEYEIIFYTSGSGKLNIEDKFFEVEKGTIAIIPPRNKHGSISYNNLCFISLIGYDELIRIDTPTILKDNDRGDGFSLMQIILANRYCENEYLNTLCLAFIYFVLKNIELSTPIEKAVNKIKSQISANFHNSDFNVTQLLNQSGYAEDYIRAHFKKIVGKSPIEYLTELRIKNSITLINIHHNSIPLIDVAINCGFDDYIYFSRRFKKVTGVSPQAYRKALINDNQK